jgi:hypothetical protein
MAGAMTRLSPAPGHTISLYGYFPVKIGGYAEASFINPMNLLGFLIVYPPLPSCLFKEELSFLYEFIEFYAISQSGPSIGGCYKVFPFSWPSTLAISSPLWTMSTTFNIPL